MYLVAQSCPTLCDPMDCSPPGSSVHGDSPDKNTGVGCPVLLQRIFPNLGSNPRLLNCRWILYCLSHQGSQEYWSGQPIPSPGELPDPGIKLVSPAFQTDSLPAEPPGKCIGYGRQSKRKSKNDPGFQLMELIGQWSVFQDQNQDLSQVEHTCSLRQGSFYLENLNFPFREVGFFLSKPQNLLTASVGNKHLEFQSLSKCFFNLIPSQFYHLTRIMKYLHIMEDSQILPY